MTSPELIFESEKGQELLKELGVPEGYAHVCTVALGYMDGERPPAKPERRKSSATSDHKAPDTSGSVAGTPDTPDGGD